MQRKIFIIDTDQFFAGLLGAEKARDTSASDQILREMGLITGDCECKLCTAEREEMKRQNAASQGDDLIKAFVSGFNFHKAGPPPEPEPEQPKPAPLQLTGETLFAMRFPGDDYLSKNRGSALAAQYEAFANRVNKFFGAL